MDVVRVRDEHTKEAITGRTHRVVVHYTEKSVRVVRTVKYPLTRGKIWSLGLFMALAIFLWVTIGGKLANDGAYTYSRYFTNWMWTFNAVFYSLYVVSFLDFSLSVYDFIITYLCWPFVANVAQVFILVAVLKVSGTRLYEEAADEVGWGLTLFWDQLVHMFPLVWALIWLMFSWTDIRTALDTFKWVPGQRRYFILYLVYNYGTANLFLFCYWAVNDFHEVYGVDVNIWLVLLLISVIYLAFVPLPIVLLSPFSQYRHDTAYETVVARTKQRAASKLANDM